MAYRLAPLTPFLALALLACGGAELSENLPSKGADEAPPGGYGASSPGGSAGAAAAAGGTAAIGGSATGGSSGSGVGGIAGTSGTAGTATTGGTGVIPDGDAGGDGGGDAGSGGDVQPGTLTAGAWDDNQNYDFFTSYRNAIRQSGRAGLLPFTEAEYDDAFDAFMGQLSNRETLDVALVIDTTGSMGDEMLYLRTEFLALSSSIASAYPSAEQRWSLVVYKDQGDVYVVRSFDFTSDLETFQTTLAEQSAGGGGDTPEAPDAALAATAELDWRAGGATARLAFWVADAPHHDERAAAMASAVRAVRDVGVHLYPVASSGIDELTEHSMRSAAQLTGGRYLFLTDDSGVGNSHKEPTVPCYFVTRLDDAILRMVDIELSGVYHEPTSAQIIRTGGNPEEGSCTLTSGDIVFAY
jgi:hypothetical protein